MKTLILIFSLTLFSVLPNENYSSDITGQWISEGEDGKGIVEIYKGTNGKVYGTLLKVLDEAKQQKLDNELDKKKKDFLLILRDFEYKGNQIWENGQILSPKRKQLVDGKLTLLNENELKVEGFLWGFSKTFTWYRKK